jgi:hypothetical protein
MPKLPIPEKLQKSLFWIVIGVLSLFAVVIWWLGTSAVAKSRGENIGTIDNWFTTVASTNPIANPKTVEEIGKQSQARKTSMNDAWQRLYANQMKEPFWPEQQLDPNGAVIKPGLPKEFVDAAKEKNMRAAEWIKARGPNALDEPLSEPLKEIYRNYAKRQIADLCQIVNSAHRIEERRGVAAPRTSNARAEANDAPQPGEICVWVTGSQQVAAEMLTFPEGTNPPTQDIIYAQANVWVYQALFNIIRLTNESIKESTPPKDLAHYNAPVKMIHEVMIGERFVVREEEGARPGASNLDEEQTPTPPQLVRAAARYVNERGQRLKGEELLALADPALPDADPARNYAQYKLMPVSMRLEVDQRYLGRLLAECANSPLTVEVKDVTFNIQGHADRAVPTMESAPAGANEPKQNKNFYDMTVDITGHIYIYFPPQTAAPAAGEEEPPAEETPADATAQAGG